MKKIALICVATFALLSGCGDKETIDQNAIAEHKKEIAQQPTSYDYNLITPSNTRIKLTQTDKNIWSFQGIKDKVVMLDLFGTWCPPCKAEIPHLNNLRKRFGKDFEIIGVDIGKRGGGVNSASDLIEFIKDFEIKYPVVFGADNGKLFRALSQLNPSGSIPFMILFDKKGNYLTHYIGMVPEEMIASDIQKALKMN
jgi:thiol-disulfide isomerase/thioredoxin